MTPTAAYTWMLVYLILVWGAIVYLAHLLVEVLS